MGISREDFRKALTNFYTKDGVYKLYNKYFINWIADGYIGLHLDIFEVSLFSEKTNKSVYIDLLEEAFYKKETFRKIFPTLDQDVRKIFKSILWSGKYRVEESELKTLFIEGTNYYTSETLKDEYKFFHFKKNKIKNNGPGYLYLHNDIIRKVRPYCAKKARDYYIHPSEYPKYTYSHNAEEEICKKINIYFNFYDQGNLKMSTSLKLLKDSKRDMQKFCGISEYYKDNKDLDYLKTETLGLTLCLIKDKYMVSENFTLKNLKKMILTMIEGRLFKEGGYQYTSKFMNYLKGTKNIKENEKLKRAIESLEPVIKEIPVGEIVSLKNIINSVTYRDRFEEFIDPQDVYDYVYINESNYGRARISEYSDYHRYITIPFIKSYFTILGSFGVFELFYDLPSGNEGLYLKNDYLSKYDGLKYVKLTELGEYILGYRESFEYKNEKEEFDVIYDEDLLLITLKGEAPIITMFLERYLVRIGEGKYKMSRERFLKGLDSKEELVARIQEFKEKFYKDLPQSWDNFFQELIGKANLIQKEEELCVFKVKEDREFLTILGKDKELKELILKGENFHIMIRKDDICKVKQILTKHGYYNAI